MRKVIWLVTMEQGEKAVGWTEKNHFVATEVIDKMKKAPGAEGAAFRIFRLTLVNGKIYANRILEKEKENEASNALPVGNNAGPVLTNSSLPPGTVVICKEGDGLSSPVRMQRPT